MQFPSWLNSNVRLWLYGLVGALLAVLLGYKILDPASVPLWLALAAAALGVGSNATAAATLVAQKRTGKVEPGKATPKTDD